MHEIFHQHWFRCGLEARARPQRRDFPALAFDRSSPKVKRFARIPMVDNCRHGYLTFRMGPFFCRREPLVDLGNTITACTPAQVFEENNENPRFFAP